MSNTTNPTTIRPTNLDTDPPVVQVQGGKDALKAAYADGRADQIEGVNWQVTLKRSPIDILTDILKFNKAATRTDPAALTQVAEAPATARSQENSNVSFENNLKPSWVAKQQPQNQSKGHGI